MANKLPEVYNQNCKNCSKEIRKKRIVKGLCRETYSKIDGLPVRCVGEWSKEKIYRLTQYFGIFANGMRRKWKNNLNYIEICSGPGRCILKENGRELDGTALAIVNHKSFKLIKNAIFVDNNQEVVEILNKRIDALGKSEFAMAVEGDYTNVEKIKSILSELPKNCLNLVLLDPTDCSIPFSLIEVIDNSLENTDFIVNVALGTDLNRNIRKAIRDDSYHKARDKYISFLGSSNFFNNEDIRIMAKKEKIQKLVKVFIKEYEKNFSKISFKYIDSVSVKNYYSLLFASKHQMGLYFWREANRIEPNGQYKLRL